MEPTTLPNPYDRDDDLRRETLARLLDFFVESPGRLEALQRLVESQQALQAISAAFEEPGP